jgi:hypothetical protein
MVFLEAVVEEVEAEVDELEALNTAQLRTRGKALGVVPVGDKRKAEVWKQALQVARAALQRRQQQWQQQQQQQQRTPQRRVPLPLLLRRQRSFANEGV